jgi:hypothetical protein
MSSNTSDRIVAAKEANPQQTAISVAENAIGLRDFLDQKGITVSPLTDIRLKAATWKIDASGRKSADDFWIARDFVADVPFDQIHRHLNDWISAGMP